MEFGKNVINIRVDNSSLVHVDNKKKICLGKGPTDGLDDTRQSEAEYSINFSETTKLFCLSLHYNRSNSFLYISGVKIYQFKGKDSAITVYPLC